MSFLRRRARFCTAWLRMDGPGGTIAHAELDIGDVTLCSVPLDPGRIHDADCVVVLTAHPGIDLTLLREAPLVFDAVGATRTGDIPGAIRL